MTQSERDYWLSEARLHREEAELPEHASIRQVHLDFAAMYEAWIADDLGFGEDAEEYDDHWDEDYMTDDEWDASF